MDTQLVTPSANAGSLECPAEGKGVEVSSRWVSSESEHAELRWKVSMVNIELTSAC